MGDLDSSVRKKKFPQVYPLIQSHDVAGYDQVSSQGWGLVRQSRCDKPPLPWLWDLFRGSNSKKKCLVHLCFHLYINCLSGTWWVSYLSLTDLISHHSFSVTFSPQVLVFFNSFTRHISLWKQEAEVDPKRRVDSAYSGRRRYLNRALTEYLNRALIETYTALWTRSGGSYKKQTVNIILYCVCSLRSQSFQASWPWLCVCVCVCAVWVWCSHFRPGHLADPPHSLSRFLSIKSSEATGTLRLSTFPSYWGRRTGTVPVRTGTDGNLSRELEPWCLPRCI